LAYQTEDNVAATLLPLVELLTGQRTDGLGSARDNPLDNPLAAALTALLNAAMRLERERHIGAAPFERSETRNGQANGFKGRALSTRLGEIDVSVPQVRGSSEPFRPKSLEAALLSEKALRVALAEMYVQGVSTRRVSAVLESLCGTSISSMTVSRAAQELDSVLSAWRERPLGVVPFVQLDALWCKVRRGGLVQDAAVLVASGVREDGRRTVLGVSVGVGEQEVHWRTFLESLVARGLRGVRLITSDDHAGLGAARRAVFGGVLWQRCQFHLQQNAQAYVPKEAMRSQVASKIRGIFNAPDLASAQSLLKAAVDEYRTSANKLADWLEEAIPQGLTVFGFPEPCRRLLRTSNGLERVNKELRRRFRVVGSFVSEASCLRLASAVLMEISDAWETGKVYLALPKEDT
jgi:transposase-like protein